MNPTSANTHPKPSWFARQWVRLFLWSSISFLFLLALAWQWFNWSGARALKIALTGLEAAGETVEFQALLPRPIPDADNFCATPALRDLVLEQGSGADVDMPEQRRERLMRLRLSDSTGGQPSPQFHSSAATGKPMDASAWLTWLRETGKARDVSDLATPAATLLQALESDDALLQELAMNLDRPYAQWTPTWMQREQPSPLFTITLPHYAPLREVTRNWSLRASAAAQCGAATEAHQATQLSLKLTQAALDDPFLISLLVAANQLRLVNDAIWHICNLRVGSAEDFAWLEENLRQLDLHRAQLRACRTELATAYDAVQWARVKSDIRSLFVIVGDLSKTSPAEGMVSRTVQYLIPNGFYNHWSARLVNTYYRLLIVPIRDHSHSVPEEQIESELQTMSNDYITGGRLVALLLPSLAGTNRTVLHARCQLDLAKLACALERHFLTHNSYPVQLTDLYDGDDTLLPRDPLNSELYRYELTAEGRYRLWSPGADGSDDGGQRALSGQAHRPYAKDYRGDWVWDYPESSAEIQEPK